MKYNFECANQKIEYITKEQAVETAREQVYEQVAKSDDEGFNEFLLGFFKLFCKVIHDTPTVERK